MREEILTVTDKEFSVDLTGNSINSLRHKDITKKGARIFKEGKIYSSSCVGSIDDSQLLEKASTNKDGATDFRYQLPELRSASKQNLLNSKNEDHLLNEFQETVEWLKKDHPDFIFSGKANLNRVKKTLRTNEDISLTHEYDICGWNFLYKHKKSAGILDGYFGEASVSDFDVASVTKEYSPFLKAFDSIANVEKGVIPVVFASPGALFRKVLESARVDFYKKDIGVFKNQLGEKIFDEKFSLLDVSYDPSILAMDFFDADGVVRENPEFPIVENGVFKNLICDSRNGEKYNMSPTGNSKRQFDTASQLGFNTVTLAPGARTVKEILADMPVCLYVEMAAGGDFTDTGDYSTPVQNGFLIRHGEVQGKAPQVTLSSSTKSLFGDRLIEIAQNPASPLESTPALFTEMDLILN